MVTIASMKPMGFLVMGVSGSGKTTLGKFIALKLQWDFFDADDFHPPKNISKMASGIPLGDSDRVPWLASLRDLLLSTLQTDRHPVLACSTLKESYRAQLLEGIEGIIVIYLKGSYELIRSRMSAREGHYMKSDMLKSQFDSLEEPQDAFELDVRMTLDEMLKTLIRRYFSDEATKI